MTPKTHLNTALATALDLPPPFRLLKLREVGDAFVYAKTNAVQLGAGALIFVGRFDLAEFAVVLEPDEPLRTARRAFYAGMAALTDALVAQAPPEKPITCVWPDTINVDGGLVGGAQFAWSNGPEDQPPDWLVFGGMIRIVSVAEGEAGVRPLSTAIEEEGFDEAGAAELVGGFARHLMVQIDAWQEYGFKEIAKIYLSRLAPEKSVRRDIDDDGDLLVRRMDRPDVERRSLIAALGNPSWLDPKTRGPK